MSPYVAQCWRSGVEPCLRQLTFRRKLVSLSTAASTGGQANLEAAWALVEPGLAPELLPPHSDRYTRQVYDNDRDPGSAAASAGHLHLLPWLLHHRLPLRPERTLIAAAPHGDLAALQDTLLLLHSRLHQGSFEATHKDLLNAVAAAGGSHAIAKLEWLLSHEADELDREEALQSLALHSCRAPDPLPILLWATSQGADLKAWPVLTSALSYSALGVVEWLVKEAGCPLPSACQGWEGGDEADGGQGEQEGFSAAAAALAAAAGGRVCNLRWLQEQGLRLQEVHEPGKLLTAASEGGHVEAVRYLHEECGIALHEGVWDAVGKSGSVRLGEWLLAKSYAPTAGACELACWHGDLPMLRWLLREAHCPADTLCIEELIVTWAGMAEPRRFRADMELYQAVRMLLGANAFIDNDADALGSAACKGHLPLVLCLREEHDAEIGPWVSYNAVEGGCEEVVEWLAAVGCTCWRRRADGDPYVVAGRRGDLATLRCLRRLGAPLRRGLLAEAAAESPLSVLQLLVEWGGAPGRAEAGRALAKAREKGAAREVVAWLGALFEGLREAVEAEEEDQEGTGGVEEEEKEQEDSGRSDSE